MKLLILKTDIETKKEVKAVKPIFNNNPDITNWSVDVEDIDNVLRIEAENELNDEDIINLLQICGFYAEPLPD